MNISRGDIWKVKWIREAHRKGNLSRDSMWSTELAVGDNGFIETIK